MLRAVMMAIRQDGYIAIVSVTKRKQSFWLTWCAGLKELLHISGKILAYTSLLTLLAHSSK